MLPILLVAAITVVVLADYLIRRFAGRAEGEADSPATTQPVLSQSGAFSIPLNYFFGKNHAWALLSEGGYVGVGMDDFARQIIGNIERIDTAALGTTVRVGDPVATLHQGNRTALIRTPVSGTVRRLNENVIAAPGLINYEPYKSWLVSIEPGNLKEDLDSMTIGREATEWLRDEVGRLHGFLGENKIDAVNSDRETSASVSGMLETSADDIWNSFNENFLK